MRVLNFEIFQSFESGIHPNSKVNDQEEVDASADMMVS